MIETSVGPNEAGGARGPVVVHARASLLLGLLSLVVFVAAVLPTTPPVAYAKCSMRTPEGTECDVISPENVAGLVRDRIRGRPVAGARVAITPQPWWPCPTAVTDASGSFRIRCPLLMPCGCNTIVVEAHGYLRFMDEFESSPLARETTVIEVESVMELYLPAVAPGLRR